MKHQHSKKSSTQSGSVFTLILGGIAMASALSYGLYQILSGPLSSMVRVTNKSSAESQVRDAVNTIVADAINTFGDCDSDGAFEPRPWRVPGGAAGSFPAGGGLIPNDIGAPQTDRWGTDFGYCVWDVGTRSHHVTCIGDGTHNTRRLEGSSDVVTGIPGALTVVAVISAGPNRHFDTTCQDYQDSATDLMYATGTFAPGAGGDDIVERRTYKQLSSQKPDLWTLKVGSTTIAVINKILEIGTLGAPQVTITPSTGLITTSGRVDATGGVRPGNAIANGACTVGTPGLLRYSTSAAYIEACDGTNFLGPSIDSLTDGKTDYAKFNVFLGKEAGKNVTTGVNNTALGYQALYSGDAGENSTAIGYEALFGNEVGTNTAVGSGALRNNMNGQNLIAIGDEALNSSSLDSNSIALGIKALFNDAEGTENIAIGREALLAHDYGTRNIGIGADTLANVTAETENIAVGLGAGPIAGINNTIAIGANAVVTNANTWLIGGLGTRQAIYEGKDNGAMGVVQLDGNPAVQVNNTLVTAYSRIFLSIYEPSGGSVAPVYTGDRSPGNWFEIRCDDPASTSYVFWEIKEPNCESDLPAPDGSCN